MKKSYALIMGLLGVASLTTVSASNIALGKAVTEIGVFGVGGWGGGILADASTLMDGLFLTEHTQWDQNSVWWDERNNDSVGNKIEINLGGTFEITGFKVQADDNDTYLLEYWNGSTWIDAWNIPQASNGGLVTREQIVSPIITSQLRFSATGGDQYYSVSEIQAFGNNVPEAGSTLALLSGGMVLIGALGRKLRK